MPRKVLWCLELLLALPVAMWVEHEIREGNEWWTLAGIPGFICAFFIQGAHGGDHLETVMATWVSIGVNTAAYVGAMYFLTEWLRRRTPERDAKRIF